MADEKSFSTAQAGDILDKVPGMPSANTILPAISQAQQQAMSLLKAGQTATTMLSSPIEIAKIAFGNTNRSFVDSQLVRNTNTGNFSVDGPSNLKSFNTANKSTLDAFTLGSRGMTEEGLTWVAGTTNKSIDGVSLPTGSSNFDLFSNLGTGQLSKLGNLGSEALSSVKSAYTAVATSLGEAMATGKQALSAVSSGLKEIQTTLVQPATQLIATASIVTNPRALGALAASNVDFLPAPLQQIVAQSVSKAARSALGSTNSNINDIAKKFFAVNTLLSAGSGDITDLFRYQGAGSGRYYNISGDYGGYMNGYSSYRGSYQSYDQLTRAVKELCGDNVNLNSYSPYNTEKSAFDLLMEYALNTGAGAIVAALMNCTSGGTYYDSRTSSIMYHSSSNVAGYGDAYTYRQILNAAGTGYTKNPIGELISLFTNTSYNAESANDVNYAAAAYNLTPRDLTYGGSVGTAYDYSDAGTMTVLQQGDEGFYSQCADSDEYAAVNMALALYGN